MEEADLIFEGVAAEAEPGEIGRYCSCNHRVLRGLQCTCGGGELVESCDMDLSGELTDVIGCLERTSRKTRDDGDYDVTVDSIDVDVTYEPPVRSFAFQGIFSSSCIILNWTSFVL